MNGARAAGFTLLEVLIALALVAIAFTAVLTSTGHAVDTAVALRDRNLAMWVARNRLAEHILNKDFPSPDTTDGETEMAGRDWRWEERVTALEGSRDLRQIEIRVGPAGQDGYMVTLLGSLMRPSAAVQAAAPQ